jgi:hypothetical protein
MKIVEETADRLEVKVFETRLILERSSDRATIQRGLTARLMGWRRHEEFPLSTVRRFGVLQEDAEPVLGFMLVFEESAESQPVPLSHNPTKAEERARKRWLSSPPKPENYVRISATTSTGWRNKQSFADDINRWLDGSGRTSSAMPADEPGSSNASPSKHP